MPYKDSGFHGKLDKHGKLVKKGKQVVLFRKYDGFALPVNVLKQIKSVEIHYEDVVYSASVEDFKKHGIQEFYKKALFGEPEQQLVLPRKYWRNSNQVTLL